MTDVGKLPDHRTAHRMAHVPARLVAPLLCCSILLAACGGKDAAAPKAGEQAKTAAAESPYGKLARADFNRRAAELELPLFWRSDADEDGAVDATELVTLWGIAGGGRRADWVDTNGAFTEGFAAAYERMSARPTYPGVQPAERKRRETVLAELAQGRPTLVETDLRGLTAGERALVDNVLAAAAVIDRLYARQLGAGDLQSSIPPDDSASRMLLFRNQSPFCKAPKTEADPNCNALAERPARVSGLYPATIQDRPNFCAALEKRADAAELLSPFSAVVVKAGGKSAGDPATDELEDVAYTVAYKAEMEEISTLLMNASASIADPSEAPLQLYLAAAAEAFLSNDWGPADEAWAQMSGANSKWYLRIGPDEVYNEPCSRKALFHLSFARIDPQGVEWQKKLDPRKAEMEAAIAKLTGPPYEARQVSFQLPDFIDIVLNAGDSRSALGGTVGQSLPNWGAVADEGRGRTVAMANLFTDADSEASWRSTASALLCPRTMEKAAFEPRLGIVTTVLHEAGHNLGPSHDYQVGGKTADEIFGGPLASMLEELKAQTSALYLTDWLVTQGLLESEDADRARLWDLLWSFGHVAEGMYDADGRAKPYSQLASIQLGTLAEKGALTWRPTLPAANSKDKGCFEVDFAAWKSAVDDLETQVLRIKGTGDRAGAETLKAEFVDAKDDWAKAREVIRERSLRQPQATLVYALER